MKKVTLFLASYLFSQLVLAHEGHHHQDKIEVNHWEHVPAVAIEVTKDSKKGWNLRVDVENFTFAPEHASSEDVMGEGHAHLFIEEMGPKN